ncbi:MAG: TIGR04282 family arsenosugar biosynthesis glycosyltransferase [Peptoniphilus sp.]|nr:TIGR04282 family arsenosugar biosynthesis glycosyltransferase [Peptoniphilus sp.]MDY3118463.1 TIGR04282 family arsenosugar biosynthesis glycosyltransferase [Peptoniphilus sp.]
METIIYFARTPEAGYGKTRLRSVLSEEQIYSIVKKLYDDLLEILTHTAHDVVIHYDGKDPFLPLPGVRQVDADLGKRMAEAIRSQIDKGPVVLLGCDLLGVDETLLEEAFRLLKTKDVVLAPAEDGGYGIIGMSRFVDVFSSITYSRPDVLEKTMERAKKVGASVGLLPTIRDIDVFEDLLRERLKSPVAEKSSDAYGTLYTAANGNRLWILNRKDKHPPSSSFYSPTTMFPFFHCIQTKETK